MRFHTLGLAALLAAALAPCAQAQTYVVGPNVNVTRLTGNQSEQSIAINRVNTNLITVGSNGRSGSGIFVGYSSNGGASWTASTFGPTSCCDPWMGADRFGNMYVSYLTSSFTTTIARSTDGGASYTVIANVAGSSDHPEMGIGPGPASGTDSIYLRDSTGGSNRIISATATGLGATSAFSTQTGVGTGNFGSVAVGPAGRATFTSMNPAGGVGPASMTIRHDADGTGPGSFATLSTVTTQVGGFRPVTPQPSRTVDAQVDLEYDSSGGVNNGTLYMLYTQAANTTTNNTDIVLRRSNDNGATFSSELKLNNDSGSNSQFFGRLAIDQTTGWLAAAWYDARNSPGNNAVEVWGTLSFDGGFSWEPNFRISQGMTSCLAASIGGDGNECGDYIALDFHGGKMVAAWGDTSNSTGDNPNGTTRIDTYFAMVTVTPVPEPGTYLLFALGLLGVGMRARRSR